LAADKVKNGLPVDRLTVKNMTVEPAGRSPRRPCQSREQLLSSRSTGRSTVSRLTVDRPYPRVGHLQSVNRSVDQPKWLACVHVLVHVGRPVRSTDSGSDRPARSTARAWQGWFSELKSWVFIIQLNPIKSLKIHKK